ncbi:MAG: uridine diphosphate-N-acetylglucosamine-binding protein YvcK [Mycobacteriales bacterium]
MRGPRVVALGGGHGLAASLEALKQVTDDLTAVVTVADDGGSSGRLRDELDILPPGDLRMALAALAGDDDWSQTWGRLLQHRFPGDGPLAGHAVGNLILAGLAATSSGMVEALDLVGRLVGARGRVLPASKTPLEIVAEVVGLDPTDRSAITQVVGQVAVATTTGDVCALHLLPEDPPACAEAVQAVLDADFVVLGPGSWFTSVITHLLVPDLRDALAKTSATRVVALNLAPQPGETAGYSPETHLEVLAAHAPELAVDVVVADESRVLDRHGLMVAVESAGGRLVLAPVSLEDGTPRHDPRLLAAVYQEIMRDSASRPTQ